MWITADRIILDGYARSDMAIEIDGQGKIATIEPVSGRRMDRVLEGRVLLPGLVNAHSHAFQRILRGRTQVRGPEGDDFWTWRQGMYWAAQEMTPERLYVVARHAFLEMILAGTTAVGEFHYLHHQVDGTPHEDPHAMAEVLIKAARDVGLRLSLLRVLYLRGDFERSVEHVQTRFKDESFEGALADFDGLVQRMLGYRDPRLAWGMAAHSLRAVPLDAIMAAKVRLSHMPFHIHVSEQPAEVDACMRHYGAPPVELLARSDIFDGWTTLIHATHLRYGEGRSVGDLGCRVCICPTTEADLGDGLGQVGDFFNQGVSLSLGTDGQTQPSMLAEARALSRHERLRVGRRNVLAKGEGDAVAGHLLKMASQNGAASLGIDTGEIAVGKWADFCTLGLDDPALAGADDGSLLAQIMFSDTCQGVRDVFVGGRLVVADGSHPLRGSSMRDFSALCTELYRSPSVF